MKSCLDVIALGSMPASRFVMLEVARRLKARHSCGIHFYCNGPQERTFYEKQNKDGLFASIIESDLMVKRAQDPGLEAEEVFERARRLEALTGLTINRMVVPDRHLGRGYALGGFYHPRSRMSENSDYVQMVNAVVLQLEFWEREFREKKFTLCINGSREAAYIAKHLGVPYRSLAGSRVRNLHYWSHTEMYETPAFEEAWRRIDEVPDADLTAPYHVHQASRKAHRDKFSFQAMVKRSAMLAARYAYWRLRGYQKAKSYYLSEEVKFAYRVWRDHRRLSRLTTTRLKDLEGKRFVFFPLQVEPETALQGISPEHFYQLSAIAAVSRDLPAGVYLAVKEAFGAIGRRPANFIEQIAEFKNVILLDTWELGFDCAQQADATVTICGTAALEALAGGKPAIVFGKHNIYNFLPSVRVVTDERNLARYLKEALNGEPAAGTIRPEAQRLLKAIEDCSFDLGDYDYINVDQYEDRAIEAAYEALLRSLPESSTQALSGAAQ